MNVIEKLLSVVAPHSCLACGTEGKLICNWCVLEVFPPVISRCYRCQKATKDFKTCPACRRKSPLVNVWVQTEYKNLSKDLLHLLKFERASAAAEIIAQQLHQLLPYFSPKTIICYCPTANVRVRIRGYDQSKLIARALAQKRGLIFAKLLSRVGQERQVGSKGGKRRKQLEGAFLVTNSKYIKGAEVLLIDDVLTTGATLEAAVRALKGAGARKVSAAVFAQSF